MGDGGTVIETKAIQAMARPIRLYSTHDTLTRRMLRKRLISCIPLHLHYPPSSSTTTYCAISTATSGARALLFVARLVTPVQYSSTEYAHLRRARPCSSPEIQRG